jgi:hypothetical protein
MESTAEVPSLELVGMAAARASTLGALEATFAGGTSASWGGCNAYQAPATSAKKTRPQAA